VPDSFSIRLYEHPRDQKNFDALNYRTFRDSIPADEPIDEEFFRSHHRWLLERYAPWDGTRNTILVAEVGGKYAGHCWIGTQTDFFTRVEEPWIYDISVMPAFRRRGLASTMLKAAQDFLRERGFKNVGLQVIAHNEAARKMYEKFGYAPHAISLRRAL
jgi:ribosomal protein S18 acetylase RimI-like enzyme